MTWTPLAGERGEFEDDRQVGRETSREAVRGRELTAVGPGRRTDEAGNTRRDREEQVLLRVKGAVEGALRDAGGAAHVIDGDLPEPVVGERRQPRGNEALSHRRPRPPAVDTGRQQLAPHLGTEDAAERSSEQVGEEFGKQASDRLDRKASALAEQAHDPDDLDVTLVVEETVGRRPGRRWQQALGEVVADRGRRHADAPDELGHREGGRRTSGRVGGDR